MARTIKNDLAVVIYLRVSTNEQGQSGLGLDAQLGQCQRCSKDLGLEVVGIFTEVISGKIDPLQRPEFMKAIAACQKVGGRFMVAKLDRLSRDNYYTHGFLNGYTVKNCPKLIVADSPYASDFELGIRSVISQEERKMISDRTRAALAQLKLQGVELGKAGRASANAKAVASTESAIARAKSLRAEGTTLEEVAAVLNTEGFLTSRGSAWSKQALHKRLSA